MAILIIRSASVQVPSGPTAWATRSTADGVLWATEFSSESDVTGWIFNNASGWDPDRSDADSELITWREGEGVEGGNCIRIEDVTEGDIQAVWWRNFDPSYTSGNHTTSRIFGPGQTFHAQWFAKVNQARLDNGGNSGLKTAWWSSAQNGYSNSAQEIFVAREYGRLQLQLVGSTATSGAPYSPKSLGGGEFDMQPGKAGAQCLYSDVTGGNYADCAIPVAGRWELFHLTVTLGTAGNADTYMKLERQLPGETAYTTIYEQSNNIIPTFEGGTGLSAWLLANRAEDHDTIPVGCYQYYTRLILSEAPIQPALTTEFEEPSAPSWFESASELEWFEIPGSADATLLDAYASLPSNFLSYSGMTVDRWDHKLRMVGNGGHGDYYGNEAYSFDYMQESCGWVRDNTPSTPTGGDNTANGMGTYADGSKRADHTYSLQIATSAGTVYFPCLAAMADADGPQSTAVWKWREADLANGENGYTYIDHVYSSGPFPKLVNTGSCFDEDSGLVWFVSQEAFQTPNPVWSINTANDAITTYGPYTGYLEEFAWCGIVPALNSLVVGTRDNTIKAMDLTTHAWTSCTSSGTGITDYSHWAVFHEAGNQIIGFMLADAGDLRVCDVPATVGGTFAWNAVAIGGATLPTLGSDESIGTYSRFNYVPDMGNGQAMLVYVPGRDFPVYGLKLPNSAI